MSTTSIAPAPAAAQATPAAPPPHGSVRWALARAEGRRLLTHPLFVLGMAVSVLFVALTSGGGGSLYNLAGGCFLFVGLGIWTFVVACLAASRERRDGAQDFYGGRPLTPRLRTQAALLSLGWAGLAGAALIAVASVALAGPDLTLDIKGERYALRPLELVQGPAYLVLLGALGVLVGSWTRHTYPAVIGALVLFAPPAAWLPWFVYGDGAPRGVDADWLVGASVGWHLVGLAGLTALAAAGALARHDRRPRVALLALAGLGARGRRRRARLAAGVLTVTALRQQVPAAARTVAWPALLAGALACVAVVVAAPLAPDASPLAGWPGWGALALCTGAAFLLDDAAGATVGATPTSLARRRLLRIALALPLLLGVWAGSLWYATSADGAWFGPDTRAALSLQLGAMLALTLAASALALRAMPDEHGGWTGAVVPFAVLAGALALPERWTLLAFPGDGAWQAAQQRWAALLALGLLTLLWFGRESAGRGGRRRPR